MGESAEREKLFQVRAASAHSQLHMHCLAYHTWAFGHLQSENTWYVFI